MAFGLSNAQEATDGNGFSQGDVFISGSVGYNSTETGDAKRTDFNVIPRAGYFVTSNIAIGLQLGYSKQVSTVEGAISGEELESSDTTTEFGVFGRYYFSPAGNFSLFADVSAAYGSIKQEDDFFDPFDGVSTVESKANGFFAGFAPGVNYFISDHFSLEATFGVLSYSTVNPDDEEADSTNNFNIGLNLSNINLGIVYKF